MMMSMPYRLATVFLVLGASLYYIPLVFSVETPTRDYSLSWFVTNGTSNTNVTVALWIMWISLAGVAVVAAWLFIRALMSATRTMGKGMSTPESTPVRASPQPLRNKPCDGNMSHPEFEG